MKEDRELLGCKSPYALNAGGCTSAVEDDDLAGRRQVRM